MGDTAPMPAALPSNCTVLVVGSRGFLGGYMVAALRAQGWTVRCLVRPRPDLRPDDTDLVFVRVTDGAYVLGDWDPREDILNAPPAAATPAPPRKSKGP